MCLAVGAALLAGAPVAAEGGRPAAAAVAVATAPPGSSGGVTLEVSPGAKPRPSPGGDSPGGGSHGGGSSHHGGGSSGDGPSGGGANGAGPAAPGAGQPSALPSGGRLPVTGADLGPLLLLGTLLVCAGTGTVLAVRRRRRHA
ncbi:hypothetical protein QEZ54_20710 [Catellatospora sp. KI3]|uniref:hypothetical protein n=1 Tax=Catellatospora sp. KI3 TaxID=3041620 RepID=UPI002482B0E5|nr:hypothetical protein [Catellatospora sp. KI3]MDI1463406.1 hypothetical protein [Catellatospora sp. KI3]